MTREAPKDKYGREFVNKEALARYRSGPDRFAHVEFFNPPRIEEVEARLMQKEGGPVTSPAEKRKEAKKGYQKSPSSVRKPKDKRLKKIKDYYGDKPKGYPRKPKGSLK